ncbi:asparagine synthetase B [glutamine-hydrolyzing] [bacterium BMS3Abin15]|nr:asparagine synthetase B [glutamine-hydrolyzing] [bacterium BMS3Abin15]HDH07513.1 asparagine synthase [Candidatus Moranbacteria bacterium]HDZ85214.1 asparagine synthase [Candidatus Moranbacteria bacterium]
MIVNNWRDVISSPVIAGENKNWNIKELERILLNAIVSCSTHCLKKNNGSICTTLSGGLDSSFCLEEIRKSLGPDVKIHTFTTGGNKKHPDVISARKVSGLFKTIHNEFIPTPRHIQRAKEELFGKWKDEERRLGNVAVFLTYKLIASLGFKCVIAHDGIDELLGGYWEHRKHENGQEKIGAFKDLWGKLEKNHLILLERKAKHFGMEVIFPYLQKEVVDYIARIPVNDRTSFEVSKMPLRDIAKKYLPKTVIERKKRGFCDALDKK